MGMEELENSLYWRDRERYGKLKEAARKFSREYSVPMVREEIFGIMGEYAAKRGKRLEIFRLPVSDRGLCAFTVVRDGRIFCAVNTNLPLAEQIFSAAGELYPICRYLEKADTDLLRHGSVTWKRGGRDAEKDAFSALILAPQTEIAGQIERCAMESNKLAVRDVVRLMESFGLPYREMVLRLFACGAVEKNRANVLLSRQREAEQFIEDTGTAARWMRDTRGDLQFGTLPLLLREREERRKVPPERILRCREQLEEMKTRFKNSNR